jgi:hypothetical protein
MVVIYTRMSALLEAADRPHTSAGGLPGSRILHVEGFPVCAMKTPHSEPGTPLILNLDTR